MKKRFLALTLLIIFTAGLAYAIPPSPPVPTTGLKTYAVADLPAASDNANMAVIVIDGDGAGDCTTGLQSTRVICVSNGSSWEAAGDGTGGEGSGSVTTIQIGDDSLDTDIVVVDFNATVFSGVEAPENEANIDLDLTPSSGNATLIAEEDALQVKYDSTLTEGASGLGIAADAIDEAYLADDSIDSEHYNDGSIDAAHLAADVIDETKIADDGIDSEHYNADSIDNEHINWADIDNLGDEGAITVADTTDATAYVALWESATGDLAARSDAGLTYNAETGVLTATGFSGPLTGNVTGTASLATTLTITDNESENENNAVIFASGGAVEGGDIGLESDGTFYYNPSTGTVTSTAFAGALTGNVTGTADTATVATTVTITDNEDTAETNAIIFAEGGDLDGGDLGLESDGNLTYNPGAGQLQATSLTDGTSVITGGEIELGAAADTTLARAAAGAVTVEGDYIILSGDTLTGEVTATFDTDGSTATTIADSVAVSSWNLTTPTITSGAVFTGADASPDADGELVYDNVTAGVDDGQFAYYGGGDTVYYLPSYVTLPTDSEDDYHLAYDKDIDRLYWRADATAGAPTLDSVGDPDAEWTPVHADEEKITISTAQDTAGSFMVIDDTDTAIGNNVYLLELQHSDDGEANADFFKCVDNNTDVWFSIQEEGKTSIGNAPATTGALNLENAAAIAWLDATPATITHVDDTGLAFNLGIDVQGSGGITLENDETITNSSDGYIALSGHLVIPDAGNIGSASDTDAIAIASDGKTTFTQDLTVNEDIIIGDAKYIGSATAPTAMQIAATGIVTFIDDILIKDAGTIGSASATTAISIASDGIVTFVDDIIIKDTGTIGSASDVDAIAIAADGKVTFSQDLIISGTGIELNHASENTLTASGGVLSIEGGALAPVASPTFTGIVTIPIAADPTTDADGEISFDTDGWGSGYDALEIWNGTASAYVVATTASDTPSNGEIPTFNTGGTITWETAGTGDIITVGDCTGVSGVAFGATAGDDASTTLYFEGSTGDAFELALTTADIATADRTVTLRDATGTVLISGDTLTGDVTATFDTDGSTAATIANDAVTMAKLDEDGNFTDWVGNWTFATGTVTFSNGFNSSAAMDFGDADVASIDKLEGVDNTVYIDLGSTDKIEVESDVAIHLLSPDVIQYEAVNDANPEYRIGGADAEEGIIQAVFDSGAQTLDYLLIQTQTADATADEGRIVFSVDEATIVTIDDGGIEFGASKVISGTTAITLGSAGATTAITSSDWAIDATGSITNVSLDADGTGNSISNIENADIKAQAAIDATKIGDGTVSSTEFQSLANVTDSALGTSLTTGTVTISTLLDVNESVDIDFNANDEYVTINNSAEYGADGAQVTIENTDADIAGAAMYLLRLRYTADGVANADFMVMEDNNGDDMIAFTDGGAATFAGVVTSTGFTIGSAAITETELEILDGATLSTTQANYLSSATGTTGTTNTNVVFSASPTLTGTAVVANIDGSGTISGNLFTPDAAGGADIGTVDLEFNDIFLNSGGVINFQDDQSVKITGGTNQIILTGGIDMDNDLVLDDDTTDSPTITLKDSDEATLVLTKLQAGGSSIVDSDGAIQIQPSGDTGDYLTISTASDIITITTVGGTDGDLVITAAGGEISFGDENLSTTGTFGAGETTLTGDLNLLSSNADAGATAGAIKHDSTITGMTEGGLRWYSGATQTQRLIVDLDTDPTGAGQDDYVVAYDNANGEFYLKQDADSGGAPAWDAIGAPTGADEIDFGAYFIELNVSNFAIGDGVDSKANAVVFTGAAGGEFQLGSAGVSFTGDNDGAFTMKGLGAGYDEDLTLNFDDTSNEIVVSSSTGVSNIDFGAITLEVGGITMDATATPAWTFDDSDSGSETTDAKIYANATDAGAGSEDVDLFFQVQIDSSLTTALQIDADGNAIFAAHPVQADMGVDINEDVDIDFDNADEEVHIANSAEYGAGNAQVNIVNSDADVGAQMYLLNLDYSADDDQANADYIIAQDSGGEVFRLAQNGDIVTTGGLDITGATELTLANDETITNAGDDVVVIASNDQEKIAFDLDTATDNEVLITGSDAGVTQLDIQIATLKTDAMDIDGAIDQDGGVITSTHTAPALTLEDQDDAAGTGNILFASANTQDVVGTLQVDIAGSATTFITLDGTNEDVTLSPSDDVILDPGGDVIQFVSTTETMTLTNATNVWTFDSAGDTFAFSDAVDVDGAFTASTVAADTTVSGTTITASTGFAIGDGDYIGITGNEIMTFNAAGSIAVTGASMDVDGAFSATTLDADTDFTVDGLVLTADNVTNDATLNIDLDGTQDQDLVVKLNDGGTEWSVTFDGSEKTVVIGDGDAADLLLKFDANTTDLTLTWDESVGVLESSHPIVAPIKSSAHDAAYTVGTNNTEEAYGHVFLNSVGGAFTLTLPSAVAGMNLCVMQEQGDTGAITVQPADGDYIVYQGARSDTAADYWVSGGAAGDKMCIVAHDATDWYVTGSYGTWTEE